MATRRGRGKQEEAVDPLADEEPTEEVTEEEPTEQAPTLTADDIRVFEDPITGDKVYRLGGQWFESEGQALASLTVQEAEENVGAFLKDVFGEGVPEGRADKRKYTMLKSAATQYEQWRLGQEMV